MLEELNLNLKAALFIGVLIVAAIAAIAYFT